MNYLVHLLKKEKIARLTILIFIILSIWWVFIYLGGTKDAPINHIFGFVYGGFSLWGAILGIGIAKKWGGFKSLIGRALYFLSFGLMLQAFGQYSFWYLNFFLKIEVPYPGIPDIGYFGTIPFYAYSALLIARISGVSFSLKTLFSKLQAVIIPLLMLGIGYFLFLKDYQFESSSPLQIFLDFGYPLGQALYISIAIFTYSLSRSVLGGIMKPRIMFVLIAFFCQFLADYIFIYFHDLYFPASFIDYFYLLAYVTMTLALIEMKIAFNKIKDD